MRRSEAWRLCLPEPHRPFATSSPTPSHARGGIRQIPETSTRRCSYSSLFPLVSAFLSWDTDRKFLMFFQKAHAVHAGDQHASSSLDSIQSGLKRVGERGDEGGAVRLPTLRVTDARGPSRVSLTEVLNDVRVPARECEGSRSNTTWASSVAGEKSSSNTVTCMRPFPSAVLGTQQLRTRRRDTHGGEGACAPRLHPLWAVADGTTGLRHMTFGPCKRDAELGPGDAMSPGEK